MSPIFKFYRFRLLLSILVLGFLPGHKGDNSENTPASLAPWYQPPSCTDHMLTDMSCYFNNSFCSYTSCYNTSNTNMKWTITTGSHGSIKHDYQTPGSSSYSHGYIYLGATDSHIPLHTKALISARLPKPLPTAVCIDFYYATSEKQGQTDKQVVRVYSQSQSDFSSRSTDVLIGQLDNVSTGGNWTHQTWQACLTRPYIAFESEKTSSNSIVALDHILITSSTMNCDQYVPADSGTSSPDSVGSVTSVNSPVVYVTSSDSPHQDNQGVTDVTERSGEHEGTDLLDRTDDTVLDHSVPQISSTESVTLTKAGPEQTEPPGVSGASINQTPIVSNRNYETTNSFVVTTKTPQLTSVKPCNQQQQQQQQQPNSLYIQFQLIVNMQSAPLYNPLLQISNKDQSAGLTNIFNLPLFNQPQQQQQQQQQPVNLLLLLQNLNPSSN